MFLSELIQFGEDVSSSCTNSNLYTAQVILEMVLFRHRQTYNIELTAPRLKYLLFHRAEYQTTELYSACQKVVLTNLLNYEGIFV